MLKQLSTKSNRTFSLSFRVSPFQPELYSNVLPYVLKYLPYMRQKLKELRLNHAGMHRHLDRLIKSFSTLTDKSL